MSLEVDYEDMDTAEEVKCVPDRLAEAIRADERAKIARAMRKGQPIHDSPGPLFGAGVRAAEECWADRIERGELGE